MKSSLICFRPTPESVESSVFVTEDGGPCFALVHATSVTQSRKVLNFMVSIKMAYNIKALVMQRYSVFRPPGAAAA